MDMTVTIGFLTGVITFFIGYLSFMRNRDKETRSDAHRDAKLETKLDMIATNIDIIRVEQKDSNKSIAEIREHLIRTDERVKQITERVDKIEERIES